MSNITRWNPLREMASVQNMMDRIFEERWRPFFDDDAMNLSARSLALDIHEDDNTYTVVTELPGVKADDIHVKVNGDYLIIEGEIPERTTEKEGERTLMQERMYGRYSRRVRLPSTVDADKVEANYEDGVLTLTLPRAESVKPRMITVKSGNSGNK